MPLTRLLLIATAFACAAGGVWWWQSTAPSIARDTAIAGVTLKSERPPAAAPLRPTVVTAATKLGQGRRAVAGMPRVDDYQMPSLRETSAGLALLIPSTPLPAKTAHQFSKPGQNNTAATTSEAGVWVRFDIYSWSEGVLVATASTPVELSAKHNLLDVPDALEALAPQFGTHSRLLLVLPTESAGLPEPLNTHDAYVLVAERQT